MVVLRRLALFIGITGLVFISYSLYCIHRLTLNDKENNGNTLRQQFSVNSADIEPTKTAKDKISSSTKEGFNSTILLTGKTKRFAYVYLLAGCQDDNRYRGFLYNILVSTRRILHDFKDPQADVIVLTTCEQTDISLLERAGALVVPISADAFMSFRQVQFLKFHVWRLVDYEKVLYLDGDILPLCSLDYLFHQETENLVIAWTKEPANGGFFLVTPRAGAYEEIMNIMEEQKSKSLATLKPPHFDKIVGWGHRIDIDMWYSFQQKLSGHKWSFYAAWSDQGLLYHYTKYVRMNVTIILSGKKLQRWGDENGVSTLLREEFHVFDDSTCRTGRGEKWFSHPAHGNSFAKAPPYSDFCHFYSVFKPWVDLPDSIATSIHECTNVNELWFLLLQSASRHLDLRIPLTNKSEWKAWVGIRKDTPTEHRVPTLRQLEALGKSIHDI